MRSRDLVEVRLLGVFEVYIRVYPDRYFGLRRLGQSRYSLDLGYVGIGFSRYWWGSFWG